MGRRPKHFASQPAKPLAAGVEHVALAMSGRASATAGVSEAPAQATLNIEPNTITIISFFIMFPSSVRSDRELSGLPDM
jgi:hypothetical protein